MSYFILIKTVKLNNVIQVNVLNLTNLVYSLLTVVYVEINQKNE